MAVSRPKKSRAPKVTPEFARAVRRAGKYEQDPARYDERTPKPGSVTNDRFAGAVVRRENVVDGEIPDSKLITVGAGRVVGELLIGNIPIIGNNKISDMSATKLTGPLTATTGGNVTANGSMTADKFNAQYISGVVGIGASTNKTWTHSLGEIPNIVTVLRQVAAGAWRPVQDDSTITVNSITADAINLLNNSATSQTVRIALFR